MELGHPDPPMSEYEYSSPELGCSSHYLLPVIRELLNALPANLVIADLGCGNGSLLAQLRKDGRQLYGLEMSWSGLDEARKAFPGIHFEHADLTSDLAAHALAGRCDAVITTEVVEHVFMPRVFARNCLALLKPKGTLIISTPYHGYLKNLLLAAMGKMDAHLNPLWDFGHIKFWSRRTLTELLEEVGFSVTEFHGVGRVPFLWKSMILVAVKREL
jgi:2-polyprenyl-6-hydroxyphenyl methylase/3-demethylubiquinone-9 3-methyltransferase